MELLNFFLGKEDLLDIDAFIEYVNIMIAGKKLNETLAKIYIQPDVDLSNKDYYDKAVMLSKELKNIGLDSSMIISAKDEILGVEEVNNLIDFEDDIGKNDSILLVKVDYYEEYSLMELLQANEKMRLFVEDIKSRNLSPFEKYLMIYDFLTSRVYKMEDKSQGAHHSRDFISVLNGEYIVCAGYAELMKRLCNAVGIKCETQNLLVKLKNKEVGEYHENNLVYLEDEKYGIKGWYYADSCWDSEKKKGQKKYEYCLLPLALKDNIKAAKLTVVDENAFVLALYGLLDFNKDIYNFTEEYNENLRNQSVKISIDTMLNEKSIDFAYNTLSEILNENQVPKDVCEIVRFCDAFLKDILAFLFVGDVEKAEESIKVIKKHYETAKSAGITGEKSKNMVRDVYAEIEQEKFKLKSLKEMQLTNVGYDLAEDILLTSEFNFEFTSILEIVKSEINKKMMSEYKNYLKEERQKVVSAKPVIMKSYKEALRVVYEAEGVPENEIEELIAKNLNYTISRFCQDFKESNDDAQVEEIETHKEKLDG